jgi:hypothetical protein
LRHQTTFFVEAKEKGHVEDKIKESQEVHRRIQTQDKKKDERAHGQPENKLLFDSLV